MDENVKIFAEAMHYAMPDEWVWHGLSFEELPDHVQQEYVDMAKRLLERIEHIGRLGKSKWAESLG